MIIGGVINYIRQGTHGADKCIVFSYRQAGLHPDQTLAAAQAFLKRYDKSIRSLARRSGRAEHEDIAQQVCIDITSAYQRGKGPRENRIGWLTKVVKNRVIRDAKSNRRRNVVSLDSFYEDQDPDKDARLVDTTAPQPEGIVLRGELCGKLAAAISQLPAHHRNVFILHHIEGLEVSEIASALELPVNTVKVQLFRARLSLKAKLQHYVEERASS